MQGSPKVNRSGAKAVTERSTMSVKTDTPLEGTHLTEDQLRDYWLAHVDNVSPSTAQRYRNNGVLFPRSRKDLIAHYTKMDLEKNHGA